MKKETDEIWPSWKVCNLFSISRASLSKWRGRGCPSEKRGYNIFKVFDWYRCNVISDPGVETNLAQEKLLRERAKRELDELKVARERGSLILKNEAIKWVSLLVAEAKQGFMNLPRRFGPVLAVVNDEKEIEELLRKEIWAILRQLAAGGKKGSGKKGT